MSRYIVTGHGSELRVEVEPGTENQRASVSFEGDPAVMSTLSAFESGGVVLVHAQGRVFEAVVSRDAGSSREVSILGVQGSFRVESERDRLLSGAGAAGSRAAGILKSPMPGRVVRVLVGEGTQVRKGEGLVVVEAMKMQNELLAESAGVVTRVLVAAGDAVDKGAELVHIEPA